jgi:hypothetical protein
MDSVPRAVDGGNAARIIPANQPALFRGGAGSTRHRRRAVREGGLRVVVARVSNPVRFQPVRAESPEDDIP